MGNKDEMKSNVERLITQAALAHDSGDAMRFSQAALNAANALACMSNTALGR
jgi:hypothetical protein